MTLVEQLASLHPLHAFFFSAALCLFVSAAFFFLTQPLLQRRGLAEKAIIEWTSRVVSLGHCLVALYTGWQCCFVDTGGAYSSPMDAAFKSTPFRNVSLMLTCGYLFYDFCLCTFFSAIFPEKSTLVHHAVIISAFALGVYFEIGMSIKVFFNAENAEKNQQPNEF